MSHNSIKYSTGTESNALRSGNMYIGLGDVSKGPTSVTNYWSGISPNPWTVYGGNSSGAPSIWTPNNDDGLISLINRISRLNFTDKQSAISWGVTQSDLLIVNKNYELISTSGLIYLIDANFTPSYIGSDLEIYDISGLDNHSILKSNTNNLPTYVSGRPSSFHFNYLHDSHIFSPNREFTSTTNCISFNFWCKSDSSSSNPEGQMILSKGKNGISPFIHIRRVIDDTSLEIICCNDNRTYLTNANHLSRDIFIDGEWVNISININYNTGLVSVYLNGIFKSEEFFTDLVYPSDLSDLYIGNDANQDKTWNGNISIVGIWDRELDPSEIFTNFESQKSLFNLQ